MDNTTKLRVALGAAIGLLAGGYVGFWMRPSTFMVGQLPFSDVISRGHNLKGFDQMLVPVAEKSFNDLAMGAGVGVVIGGLLALAFFKPPK